MKKNLLLISAVAIIFGSCQKNEVNEPKEEQKFEKINGTLNGSLLNFPSLNATNQQLMSSYIDLADRDINAALYELGEAIYKNMTPQVMNAIITGIEDAYNTDSFNFDNISVDEIFAMYPQFANSVNNYIANNDPNTGFNHTSYSQIKNKLNRNGISYIAVINIPNFATVNNPTTNNYVVSPAIQIDDEVFNQFNDAYFGWQIKNGVATRVALEEATAKSYSGAILTLSLSVTDRPGATIPPVLRPTHSNPYLGGASKTMYNTAQKYYQRFENDKHSEIKITAIKAKLKVGHDNLYDFYSRTTLFNDHIDVIDYTTNFNDVVDLHYSSIDMWLFNTKTVISSAHTFQNDETIVLNIYERDWINSNKEMGGINLDIPVGGSPAEYAKNLRKRTLWGEMRYLGEFYIYDDGAFSGSEFTRIDSDDLKYIYDNGEQIENNSKGTFVFKVY